MLLYLLGVLVVLLGVGISIALHEIGHLVPAKASKVRVTQYMVGFGPTVWSRQRGETEYGIKAIPLGGYIRMIGMLPPRPQDPAGTLRRGSTGLLDQMADDAREADHEQVRPEDTDRLFYRLPVWRKVMIMLGGPLMNLVLAAVLLTGVLTLHGVAEPTTRIASVVECAPEDPAATECGPQDERSPAALAGLEPGDQLITVGGAPAESWEQVSARIREAGGQELQLTVERDGRTVELTAEPVLRERPVVVDGQVQQRDGKPVLEEVGYLGASPAHETVRQTLSAVPGALGDGLWATAKVVLTIPARLVDVGQTVLGLEERDPNGPMSVVGVGRVTGEVTSSEEIGLDWPGRIAFWGSILASLNMALFVFNLVPLLPLDGGHVAGALWEGLRRWWARVRGLPDPGHVDVAKMMPLATAMALVLVVMSVLLVYADLVKPIRLG
ncbi:Membrane-associated protease RseP, regulator of RpoE activity [Kytococcus aerolatus]|uniref:Membrane-associated protease RseP, regulator of RpoE activity n=1 Tax=Kytococcus aerolatus TaxID=592308 RepID=A0A212U1Y2_9MICO|nr:M50 family metallopeptidase [Kytococcus aerolatus]SNC72259.1 Membrane-associated protease RseP, regulator of RpoE activity [Kytococcus aerolatus]